ncbi:MAG: 50S ribosomal protein L18 [Candidatus Woesebacteria bacterium GW2011_GWA1_45_8]|uniref:Large ribosomal subunit protein uL18 n=1 Tax=Candidatus Woesebacteria bacterium GW2011_GWA1_45_8 TaxID=1618559 RepID=A0A0G1MVQ1_9BACT|nr:MAG: 50S ribosomal protein L18 [Candidatus Woesebacteria bacterium GW2011_GWA1_45_8]
MSKISSQQRKARVRVQVKASGRPRLSVFRSNKYIYAQIIDEKGSTLASLSTKNFSAKIKQGVKTKLDEAAALGEQIAAAAKKKKVSKVVFDRGEYKYHGRVKALAEGARKGGLNF